MALIVGLCQVKTRARSFIGVVEAQAWVIFPCFPSHISKQVEQSGTAGTELKPALSVHLTHCAKALLPPRFFSKETLNISYIYFHLFKRQRQRERSSERQISSTHIHWFISSRLTTEAGTGKARILKLSQALSHVWLGSNYLRHCPLALRVSISRMLELAAEPQMEHKHPHFFSRSYLRKSGKHTDSFINSYDNGRHGVTYLDHYSIPV